MFKNLSPIKPTFDEVKAISNRYKYKLCVQLHEDDAFQLYYFFSNAMRIISNLSSARKYDIINEIMRAQNNETKLIMKKMVLLVKKINYISD